MGSQCSEVLADLPLYVGGDLEAPSRDAVAAHLDGCSPCRDALARASEARAVLSEHFERTAATPSASVWPELRERLRAEGLVHAPATPQAPVAAATGGRLLRFLPHAAAAAALLFAGVLAGEWLRSGPVVPAPNGGAPSGDVPSVAVESDRLAEPGRGESVLRPVEPGGAAVAEVETPAEGGLRAVDAGESLGERASLFDAQPIRPFTPFQASQLRMASYGQPSPQQPPAIDPTQLLLKRGIR